MQYNVNVMHSNYIIVAWGNHVVQQSFRCINTDSSGYLVGHGTWGGMDWIITDSDEENFLK
eukprot:12925029-Prorocentrum_lima.AAC.1